MKKRWASSTGVHAFAASYTKQMIDMANHAKFERRHSGRTLQALSPETVLLTAFGLVLGCKEQAFTLARMQLSAHPASSAEPASEADESMETWMRRVADTLSQALQREVGKLFLNND